MRRILVCSGLLSVALVLAQPAPDIAARLARWKTVQMPFHPDGLTARDRQMVDQLVEACRLLNDVYWRQSDAEGLKLFLNPSTSPQVKQLLNINGSRWDLIDGKPFYGAGPQPPGREFYPQGLTRAQIEEYVAKHPSEKAAIYSGTTVVKRQGDRLVTVAYHEEYKALLTPMAQALRKAADLSSDAAFGNFLRLRADALLNDDYYKSDLAWVDLKDPKVDIIFAPYETYLDDVLGVKGSYGASVLIRNEAETRKLAMYQQYVPKIQTALPLDPADRPSKAGQPTPMEVMDAPYRAGDLRYGYQAVADNLPNDPRIHQEKGTKKIFFNNFLFWRTKEVIVPLSKRLMPPDQAAKVSAEAFTATVVMHEICHGLGPDYSQVNGKKTDIREAIGPTFGGLEEAKADVVGMFGLKWLVDQKVLTTIPLDQYYSSYVASIFRTVRFGTGEAHGKAEMMEFNYLLENHALSFANGRYKIDFARMPVALAQLAKELLDIEATGDRGRAERWFAKYGTMPADLSKIMETTKDIPVDISPVFSFADNLR
ncbi:MAG TPA: Zn-dependent hydrolase [Bryobacteraceae bacterium]|jgi:hypothetical protein